MRPSNIPLALLASLLLAPMGGCIFVVNDHDSTYESASFTSPRMIGVETEAVTSVLADQTGVDPARSCVITRIVAGSPAEAAGLKRNDIITAADAEPGNVSGLRSAVQARSTGENVHLKLLRAGKPMELDVAVASRAGAD